MRFWFKPAFVGAIAACSSPPPAPSPDREPNPPSANECSPTPRVAHATFHFADLASGKSCPVFLEQDECVVAIFSDCTDEKRHWEGRMTVEGRISIGPEYVAPPTSTPPTRCEGDWLDPTGTRPAVFLSCRVAGVARHPGIYLERAEATPPTLGHVTSEHTFPGPIVALLPGRVIVGGASGGIYAYDSGPRSLASISNITTAADVESGWIAVGHGAELSLVDRNASSVVRSATMPSAISLVAQGFPGELLIALEQGSGSVVRRVRLSDLGLEPPTLDPGGPVSQLGIVSGSSPALAAIAYAPPSAQPLVSVAFVEANLAVRREADFDGRAATGSASAGGFFSVGAAGMNGIHSIRGSNAEEFVLPLPYFGDLSATAAGSDGRLWAAGVHDGAVLGAFDVASSRPLPGHISVGGPKLELLVEDGASLLASRGNTLFVVSKS